MNAVKKGLFVAFGLFAALAGLLVVLLIWGVGVNNKIVRLDQGADAQWAQVQNVYQRRADLIPNLVSTVQGAANFERGTLQDVINARASVGQVKIDPSRAPEDPAQLRQFQAAQDQLSSALSRLLVVIERYPDLKANQGFLNLQAQLEGSENRITVERGSYNEKLREYNTFIQQIPATFVASARNFKAKPYFEAAAGADRPPPVQFDFNKAAPINK